MARRPISSRLHGILDYTTAATLVAAPALLGLGGTPAGRILRGAGATHAGYSAVTRYELGAVKLLPYRAHLALDAVAAIGLTASPWLFGTARRGRAHWLPHVVFGIYELGAVALSDPSGVGHTAADGGMAGAASATAAAAPATGDAAGDPTGRRVVPGAEQGVPMPPIGGGEGARRVADDEPSLSHPSELPTVYPEGSQESDAARRGAVGDRAGSGGAGSGTGPGSDAPVGGLER
jgi:hypothetical protein